MSVSMGLMSSKLLLTWLHCSVSAAIKVLAKEQQKPFLKMVKKPFKVKNIYFTLFEECEKWHRKSKYDCFVHFIFIIRQSS